MAIPLHAWPYLCMHAWPYLCRIVSFGMVGLCGGPACLMLQHALQASRPPALEHEYTHYTPACGKHACIPESAMSPAMLTHLSIRCSTQSRPMAKPVSPAAAETASMRFRKAACGSKTGGKRG